MQVNLVSFNVPYPPNYGGVIDVYYKIKALHAQGVKVHLHCFDYGRGEAKELLEICKSVNYYPRHLSFFKLLSKLPFIVATRSSKRLVKNLTENNFPIILEGIHCTYPLLLKQFEGRKIVVRTHNVEHQYYNGLQKSEKNFFKRLFFKIEKQKLKKYESILTKASAIAAISALDEEYFKIYNRPTQLVTPFHPFNEVKSVVSKGNYILIHGDLSVAENIKSVSWLLENVAAKMEHRFVVAGKSPAEALLLLTEKFSNVELVPNPSDELMNDLVVNAQINLIHSFFPQGFKLKLIHSLYKGRFCICNPEVVLNTGVENLCVIANSPQSFVEAILKYMEIYFDEQQIELRKEALKPLSNASQAQKLIELLVMRIKG